MSKGLIGYLVGHAVCEKHISSLDDVVSKYVPETEQTIYKDAKIGDMINMSVQYGIKQAITCVNTGLVIHGNPAKRKTVKEVLSLTKTLPTDVGMFRYSFD